MRKKKQNASITWSNFASSPMLRLLVPSRDSSPRERSIDVDGRRWVLVGGESLQPDHAYVCVSYAWGDKRVPNALHGGTNLMSARTMDVLQTAIRTLQNGADILAIWIDAFCLPPRGDPSRT